ncbi:SpoIIE family protein phosphatase [Desulfospira joergensenii]|uniref:SpoIIE family protein phosphatase n=1 Tax=Desulfospira joergensenii TaxID=53329 RepID=UPI0003B6F609|nr:SpoIIE family protein phosphatase [Desulfospira joergensenii]
MQPKTLQQRIALFVLIPVFFILAGMGWASFLYARKAILKQWGETAIANLQKASHLIDMRLSKPKDLLLMLRDRHGKEQDFFIREFILEQLKAMEGVVDVVYEHSKGSDSRMGPRRAMPMEPVHFNKMGKIRFSLPRYDTQLHRETISLSSEIKDSDDRITGRIELVVSFEDLIDQISKAPWWKSNTAFLIDNEGHTLSATKASDRKQGFDQTARFGETDPLERQTLEALNKTPYGTIFGPGHPPERISGYYHLKEAPWSLVLISPGSQVLSSILNFRRFYLITGFFAILGVLVFIRTAITGTADAIKNVSRAAKDLADGAFGEPLPVLTKDEVGELTFTFNRMTKQLKERLEMKEALGLAKEIQQSLLPPANLSNENLEISGCSIYCDETGGDYFDVIEVPGDPGKIYLAVGDVVGHGIGAALLMATTRALLRSRIMQNGSLSQILNDVNQLICMDSGDTGSFVTFFLMKVDHGKRELTWIRAGHEPAMVFHPEKDGVSELSGEGIVLGLDDQWKYRENTWSDIPEGTVVLVSTDGVRELENRAGERFGKDRLKQVLQQSHPLSPEEIIKVVLDETKGFCGEMNQKDDITLLALKFKQTTRQRKISEKEPKRKRV